LDKFIQLFRHSMAHHHVFARQAPEAASICYDDALFHKGFLLQAAIQMQKTAQKDSVSAARFHLYKSYQRRLALELAYPKAERSEADSLLLRIHELEKILAGTNTDFGAAMRELNWQQVKAALRPGEAAIEFVHYDTGKDSTRTTQYAALILTSDTPLPQQIPLFEEQYLKEIFGNITVRGITYVKGLYQNPSQDLYNLCWAPVEAVLPDTIHTIYYAPSGLLHRLNLSAISMPDDMNGTISGELIERYRMIQLGSTRQLIPSLHASPEPFSGDLALFGAIHYDPDTLGTLNNLQAELAVRGEAAFSAPDTSLRAETWKYLKATEAEIRIIQNIALRTGAPAMTFTGYEASEETLKQLSGQAPKVLHVATHGFFYTGQSAKSAAPSGQAFKYGNQPLMRSGLIMAGGKYAWNNGKPYSPHMEDGILTAYEVSQMDLNGTELVVLSACETALGDVAGYEGVFGLQRAFKIAGAKYLIMSLWQVRDRETQELMASFYHHWLEKKQSIPEAFRSAQGELKSKYHYPYFWAGFVLIE
jgi:CHAT domain-containing protein